MEKRAFSLTGCYLVVISISSGILSQLLVTLFIALGIRDYTALVLIVQLCYYLFALGLAKLFTVALPKNPTPTKSRLRFGDLLFFLLMCIGVLYVGAYLGSFASEIGAFLVDGTAVNPVDDLVSMLPLWCTVTLTVIMAPVMEELIFRRLLLDVLRPFGDRTAALVCGLLFGLFHMNLSQFFYAAALGFLLSYVMLRTNNLWYPILLHGIINLMGSVLIPALSEALGPETSTGNLILNLALIVLMLVGIAVFASRVRRFVYDAPLYRFSRPINGGVIFGNVGMILVLVTFVAQSVIALQPSWLPDWL